MPHVCFFNAQYTTYMSVNPALLIQVKQLMLVVCQRAFWLPACDACVGAQRIPVWTASASQYQSLKI